LAFKDVQGLLPALRRVYRIYFLPELTGEAVQDKRLIIHKEETMIRDLFIRWETY
jgi:hypothetical protein